MFKGWGIFRSKYQPIGWQSGAVLALSVLLIGPAFGEPASLQGRWALHEHACVSANNRVVIGPGFPGERESWVLTFDKSSDAGRYAFDGVYIGFSGNDCRLSLVGDFRLAFLANGILSAVNLLPIRTSVIRVGPFPAPCRVVSGDKMVHYEARLETFKDNQGNEIRRLRMLGPDSEKRCNSPREKSELVWDFVSTSAPIQPEGCDKHD